MSWNPANGIPMTKGADGAYTVTISVPASDNFEYKYIRKDSAGNVSWESDPNNRITTPATGPFTVNDTWR